MFVKWEMDANLLLPRKLKKMRLKKLNNKIRPQNLNKLKNKILGTRISKKFKNFKIPCKKVLKLPHKNPKNRKKKPQRNYFRNISKIEARKKIIEQAKESARISNKNAISVSSADSFTKKYRKSVINGSKRRNVMMNSAYTSTAILGIQNKCINGT